MKLYQYDIRNLSQEEYIKWYSLMSKEKKVRVDRFRFEDDKKRTVIGEMLARQAISAWCNIAVENIVFNKNEYGKPFVKDLAVEFNISHSEDMVVCIVDKDPIGIDIEKIRPIDLSVARRICNDDELLYLFNHTPTEDDFSYTEDIALLTRFFEIWTKKEAIVKFLGCGNSKDWRLLAIENYQLDSKLVNQFYMLATCYGIRNDILQ